MRKNIVLVSFGLILVILFHASGIVEKGLGMKKKSKEDQAKVGGILSVLKIPNFPPKVDEDGNITDEEFSSE